MSAVEAAPPPPRPPPPGNTRGRTSRDHPSGVSMDLESAKLDDTPSEYNIRRRTQTLGSRPTSRHTDRQPHVIETRQTERPPREPHVIDSSGQSSRNSGKTEEQQKSVAPTGAKPNRPPPPKGVAMFRSLSQPANTTARVGQSAEDPVKGSDAGGPVLRRRLSSEGSRSSRSSSSHSLKRLSSPSPRGSREVSPLPQLPEDMPTTTPTSPTPILTPPTKPPPLQSPSSTGPSSSPSPTTPSPHPSISPPPSGPLPLVPKRPRAVSSPTITTPPPNSPDSKSFFDTAPKPPSPTKKNATQSPSHLMPTTPTLDVPPQEDNDTPSAPDSGSPLPVIPPRPFRPPRPYPPSSANGKASQRKPRPKTAPVKSGETKSSPATHPSRRSPRHTAKSQAVSVPKDWEDPPVRPSRRSPRHTAKARMMQATAPPDGTREKGEESSTLSPVRPSRRSPRHTAKAVTSQNAAEVDRNSQTSPVRATSGTSSPLDDSRPISPAKTSPARRPQKTGAQDLKADQLRDLSHDRSKSPSSPTSPPPPPPSTPAPSDQVQVKQPTEEKLPQKQENLKPFLEPGVQRAGLARQESDHEAEMDDMVNSLPPGESPTTKGRAFMNSMKNSFKSLRLKTTRRPSPGTSRRTQSDAASIYNKNYPDPLPPGIIHPLVVQCVGYLNRETVLVEEGLFRVPGDLAVIRKLRQAFTDGYEVDLMEVLDPHTVAGLLKLHFREMKSSLIPRGLPLIQLMTYVKNQDIEAVCGEFEKLEVVTVATLSVVIEVLAKITAHSAVNHMTSGILATSCGPSLFPYLPPSNANQMTKFLVDNWNTIFKNN